MIDGSKRRLEERPYQCGAVKQACDHWTNGVMSVLIVAPPGSGKTEMGIMAIRELEIPKTLWVVHTRELAMQAEERLKSHLGVPVSVIMEGRQELPSARVIVAVVHSLIGRRFDDVELMALDEGHHYVAEHWGLVRLVVPGTCRILGLTATPERDDGRPLSEAYQEMVVAAQYSELIARGNIVPARIFAPKTYLRSDWAQHPVDAWFRFAERRQTIAFYPSIAIAQRYTESFVERGVAALPFHSELPRVERDMNFERFESGECEVLSTVAAAIEGLNIPRCGCAILARSFHFIGGYLQAPARALRAAPGKGDGIIIDLTGASVRHGAPDQDRAYSIEARETNERPALVANAPDYEREEPSVVDAEMVMTQRGALGTEEMTIPQPMPDPDPARLKREMAIEKELRKIRTRYGADAASKARKQLEALI